MQARPGRITARLRSVVAIVRGALSRYSRHPCSELAAAIAYRVLFSLVPFVALLAAVLDAVLSAEAREDVIGWLLGAAPGSTLEDSVDRKLADSGELTTVAGLIAFGTLMWTASGMTHSVRVALAIVWETDSRPAFVRAKLRDIAALGLLAALVIGCFALSLASQIATQAGVSASEALGLEGAARGAAAAIELAATGAATFAVLLVVYRRMAPVTIALSALWSSTLVMAVAIDAGLAGYAFYLVHIASFNTIYGPLGGVLAFLALLYFAAMLLLFGAALIVTAAGQAGSTSVGFQEPSM